MFRCKQLHIWSPRSPKQLTTQQQHAHQMTVCQTGGWGNVCVFTWPAYEPPSLKISTPRPCMPLRPTCPSYCAPLSSRASTPHASEVALPSRPTPFRFALLLGTSSVTPSPSSASGSEVSGEARRALQGGCSTSGLGVSGWMSGWISGDTAGVVLVAKGTGKLGPMIWIFSVVRSFSACNM